MSLTVEDLKRTRSLRSRRAGGYQNRLLNPGDCAPADVISVDLPLATMFRSLVMMGTPS